VRIYEMICYIISLNIAKTLYPCLGLPPWVSMDPWSSRSKQRKIETFDHK
jgi:hypothetical protein